MQNTYYFCEDGIILVLSLSCNELEWEENKHNICNKRLTFAFLVSISKIRMVDIYKKALMDTDETSDVNYMWSLIG